MKAGAGCFATLNELALAYELRQSGCCWKLIAIGLGKDDALKLERYVHTLTVRGMPAYLKTATHS